MAGVFAKGAFTGLTAVGLGIAAITTTGAGTIANYYALYVTPSSIGTANYTGWFSSGNVVFSGDGAGIVFIGDTANAQMTTGLTINQGTADNEILALKSSDINHGMTGVTETVFRMRGKGMPELRGPEKGDQMVRVHIVVPEKLSKREKELIKELDEEKPQKGFFKKIFG